MKIKKIAAHILVMIMVGTMVFGFPVVTNAAGDDGDVVENPWGNLFKDDTLSSGEMDAGTSGENTGIDKGEQKVGKTKVVSATKKTKKSKKAKIKLKKIKGVKGYQVQYSTSKKFKKVKTKNFKKNKFTINKLKSGRKYYVRARAYKKIGGKKIFGEWSAKKRIRVDK